MGSHNLLVAVVLLGWFPAALMLFMVLPPRRAVIVSLLAAWLMLPVAKYDLDLLPDISKTNVISMATFLGVVLFDFSSVIQFRMRWFDIPAMLLCLAPLFSSVSNELGFYDGVSGVLAAMLVWGIPYLLGRIYFSSLESIRELAIGIFIAGLLYMPLCLYEIRMSPQLHYLVYGYHQHEFIQHFRFGGWRPKVFLDHGLMVGMFMTGAALCGYWLWRSRSLPEILGIKIWVYLAPLMVTVFLIKSFGAVMLLLVGMVSLLYIERMRRALPITILTVIPIVYIIMRTTFLWPADQVVSVARFLAGPERAHSVAYRIQNERLMAAHALERPIFGWGGWDRARLKVKGTRDFTITDSLWIIAWGNTGFFGLTAMVLMILLPPMLLKYRLPPPFWLNQKVGPAVVVALVLLLWAVDSLFNAMVGPIYPLMAGGLVGVNRVMALYPVAVSQAEQLEAERAHRSMRS